MKEKRTARVSAEYQRAIYEIISSKVKDASLTEMFSVLRCDVASDLKHAKVYISIFSADEGKKKATFKAIENAAGFIKRELAQIMRTHTVPELHFVLDDSLDYGGRIDKILADIKKSEK